MLESILLLELGRQQPHFNCTCCPYEQNTDDLIQSILFQVLLVYCSSRIVQNYDEILITDHRHV